MATRNPKNITIGEGRPGRNEGRDGDMTIRTIRDMGTMLFVKAKGKWFNINLNKDLKTDRQQDISYALPGNPKKPGEIRLSSGEVKTKNESGQDLEMVAIDNTGVQLGGVGKNSSVIVPNNATALGFKKSGATNMMHFKTDTSPNSVVFDNFLRIAETGSAPSGADSGYGRLYVKSSDGKIYFMDEGGSETDLTSGGGGGGSSTYKGLTGIVAVNIDTSENETLDGDHIFLHFGTLQIDHEITISSGKTLEFIRLGGE